jgi:hypothetical protein
VIADVQIALLDEILGMGVALRVMPYECTEREYEPEPQASSSRGGLPPRKITGVGVLDPPVPPRKQPGPLAPIPASRLKRIFAVIILIGAAISLTMLLMHTDWFSIQQGYATYGAAPHSLLINDGVNSKESGGPERSRTSDNLVRSQVLYPAELQARRNNTCVPTRLRHTARDFNSSAHRRRCFSVAFHSSASIRGAFELT